MEIESPQILIPASPQSEDMIVVELGNIAISNEIITKMNPRCEMYLFFACRYVKFSLIGI